MALDILSRIWYYGNFKIETVNERVLAGIMNELRLFPTTEVEILNRPSIQNYFEKYTNYTPTTQPKEEDKPVLFITEDGVEIRNGDHAFYVQDDNNWMVVSHSGITEKRPYPYFHTSESANKWVLENKPCLSLNDLLEVWTYNPGKVEIIMNADCYKRAALYKNFEQKAKQKLKQ